MSETTRRRQLRLCYWDSSKKHFGRHKALFEKSLKSLGDLTFYELRGLDDPQFFPCDLLLVAAETVPDEDFSRWLGDLSKKIQVQKKIWVPTILLSRAGFATLENLLADAVKSNWYFDVVHPDHIDSLPIRVSNLLRIHDHLHEIKRYDEKQQALQKRVDEIEELLQLTRQSKT